MPAAPIATLIATATLPATRNLTLTLTLTPTPTPTPGELPEKKTMCSPSGEGSDAGEAASEAEGSSAAPRPLQPATALGRWMPSGAPSARNGATLLFCSLALLANKV